MSSDHHYDRAKEEVVDRVLDVVKSFSKVYPSKVTPDVHFQKDLGLDSLDNVEIFMALEEEFKLEIPDKEADKIDSCNLAIDYVHNHPLSSRFTPPFSPSVLCKTSAFCVFFVRFDSNFSVNLITKDL
ncbi:hypothetical protein K2173_024626 [Erythroxylum novogranatense]|uniref:Acyl carrier protein n=1 Tax=Erythroxylum novogranatense TaxID=1862640 RepID=A0AAV8SVN1_9ROSI|nr:hypothetical protein K2173_024626 [Erythroxylum novogranatense]